MHAADVQQGEQDQQSNDAAAQVPDVLRFEAFELNGLINAFVDGINAV